MMDTAAKSPDELIAECQGLVRSLALQIQKKLPPHFDLDDLIADGQIGLAQAARDFDPEQGTKFSTFAYYRVRGAIYDGISKVSWTSRSAYQKMRYQKLANQALTPDDKGDESKSSPAPDTTPALARSADWLGQTTAKLAIVYLGSQADSDQGGLEAIDEKAPNPAQQTADQEVVAKLQEIIARLPEPAQTLIKAVYFEGMTLQDAGKQVGLSKSWASRLHSKALDQMARSLRRLGVGN